MAGRAKGHGLSQEGIVLALAAVALIVFSLTLPAFLTAANLLSLVRSVSILGMLGLGMAIAVIGRGIDVSMIATMVVAVSWAFVMTGQDTPFGWALVIGAAFALLAGALIGCLIAYCDVPAIFATLAMGGVIYGWGRTFFIHLDMQNVPGGHSWFDLVGHGTTLGVPVPILVFGALGLVVHLALGRTRFGWFVYALGNNPAAASVTGLPIRAIIVGQYTACALIAFVAGLVLASSADAINARLYNSTMIYDVLLVVVLGGVGLNGGHGGVRNVMLGTLLVGILLNGMTIMNLDYTLQNLVKGVVLVLAIAADAMINPRDEQTSQQGDI